MVDLAGAVPKRTVLELPAWLWGGKPEELLQRAGFHSRRESGDRWQVQTEEQYLGSRASLVNAEVVVGKLGREDNFDRLQRRADVEPAGAQGLEEITRAQLAAVEQRTRAGEITDHSYLWGLRTVIAPASGLGSVVRQIYQEIAGFRVNPGEPARFPDAEVYLVLRSLSLVHRVRLVSVLLRLSYDDTLRRGETEAVRQELAAGGPVFASGDGLTHGVLLFDAYLGPLLGCLSPNIWAFSTPRTMGSLIYALGQTVAGVQRGAAEMLQTLPTLGPSVKTWKPESLAIDDYASAVRWWSERLNDLFAILTNPAVFTDKTGQHLPSRHHQALMTVEQLFRRVASLQASHRDGHATRVLLMTVLDTAMRLNGFDVRRMAKLSFAEKRLGLIRAAMPPRAAAVLLPNALRGIEALRQLQDGFFIASAGTSAAARKQVHGMSLEDAAAAYVDILRNATHGHGARRSASREETNALLAHHDGDVPHDLAYLGYLYLLDIMCQLETLRVRFHSER